MSVPDQGTLTATEASGRTTHSRGGSVVIRRMRPEDLPAALAVLDRWNMAPVAPSADIPDPERSELDVTRSFVAEDGGRVVGVCSYILHSAEVAETASLAVHPDYRGQGVGYRLQCARLRALKGLGVREVRTEADRAETIAWYVRKFGYERTGTSRKKHAFGLSTVSEWTILRLDLERCGI